MTQIIWMIILLPLMGVLINGRFGKRLGNPVSGYLAAALVGISFFVGLLAFFEVPLWSHVGYAKTVKLWDFITIGDFDVDVSMLVDPLSMMMVLIITGVGTLIHIYAIGYMDHDENFSRFFVYLNLFIASMLILVLSDNYLGMYIGWELVGVCSYLLIGFWFDRDSAADAGKKAFIVNRIGDFGFALGVFLIWSTFGSLRFLDVFEAAPQATSGVITAITALLFVGAIGKSAQIPLYVWLPDAMEGPTPVSALIHAATMVTAGIYMVVRSNVLYTMAPTTSAIIAIIGVSTALFAATMALVQYDLKRVLAYSTISQLGYMVLAVGVGAYTSAMFHLATHAFFKALLFMGAGSVMHAMHDVIDMRRLGGLQDKMPDTFKTFIVGAAALAGFPFVTSGFWSKDEILANTFGYSTILYILGLITAFLTAFYSARMVLLTFFGEPKDQELYDHAHENKPVMTYPLYILAGLSILGMFLGIPGSGHFLNNWLDPVYHVGHHISLFTEVLLILVSAVVSVTAIWFAYKYYVEEPDSPARMADRFGPLYKWAYDKYYVDEYYDRIFVQPGKFVSNVLSKFDLAFLDTIIVDGTARSVRGIGRITDGLQTGYLRNYITSIFIGCIVIAIYFFIR
ncbi:MAG: NADH-quinone oxidoreductase subunit L [Chloroflexota bacterium]